MYLDCPRGCYLGTINCTDENIKIRGSNESIYYSTLLFMYSLSSVKFVVFDK